MLIWVESDKQRFSLVVAADATIFEIKNTLAEITSIPAEEQILLLNNNILQEGFAATEGVIENSLINLHRKKDLMEFSAVDSYHVINNFNDSAPPWREFYIGLNLEGICLNPACAAFDKRVWIIAGTGVFDIKNKNNYLCPICSESVEIDACGFFRCSYKLVGINQSEQEITMESTAGNYIKYYNSGIAKNNWKTLEFYIW